MSFKDKMLAANGFNVGRIESPDFPCGKIIVKNDQLVIINAAMGKGFDDYEIHQEKYGNNFNLQQISYFLFGVRRYIATS